MNKPNEIRNDEYLKKYAFPPKTSLMKKFLELFFESKKVIKNLEVCNNLKGLNTKNKITNQFESTFNQNQKKPIFQDICQSLTLHVSCFHNPTTTSLKGV